MPNIISKNFLQPNEEMVTYAENNIEEMAISKQLELLEMALTLRRFPKEEIQQTKFEFLRQEFIAKMVGLRDQTPSNSPIIISTDEKGKRHVKMAPMHDLDFSFHVAEGSYVETRKCDNGKDDIVSLVEQYKNYPGFMDFVKQAVQAIDMEAVFRQIYRETGLVEFEQCQDNELLKPFEDFVNANARIS